MAMALRTLLCIFTVIDAWSEVSEAPHERSPAILHLDEGNDWLAGFHPRRLSRSCHQRILLKLARSAGDSRRLARRLFEEVSGLEHGSWHRLTRVGIDIAEIRCGQDVNQTLALIREKLGDQLDFVELDEEIYMPLQAVVDPVWPQQWGLQRVGFENAWAQLEALEVTPSEVVVALIDTGFNFLHEDIQGRVWVNEGEIAGNGIDDDGNGFVDDVNGFNFVDNNGAPEDDSGHGTHNAGIVAAQVNNLGVAGAAGRNQMVKLMIVKALTANGGFTSDAINALNYAMAMGAEISSNSWGGLSESLALQTAIQVAMEAGHLFVSAAGNDNRNADDSPFYPCVYPHVLCVAASDDQDQFAFFSNYGQESVELVAPGQGIISTYLENTQYASLTGTSFGTSMVAGAAALLFSWLRSATNTVHSVEDIRWLLLETAEKLSWTEGFVGNGMLDVDAAASKALSGVGYSWLVGPWSLCRRESCNSLQGMRLRNVSCVGSDGIEVEQAQCEEAECQDTVSGWRDSYDAPCSIYESYNWCTSTGNYASGWLSSWGSFADYARDGYDATQVCCACGGGTLEAGNVPFASQECPEAIGGPDANYDGLDDCMVTVVTTTATSATATTLTDTTVTVTTITMTSQTRSRTTTSTGTSSTMTSSTVTTHTETTTSSSTTATSTSSTVTSYSTVTSSSTSSMSSTSSTATITSHTETSTSSSTDTRTTSTSSSFTVSSSSSTRSSSSSSTSSSSSSSTTSETKSSSSTTSSTLTRTTSSTVTSSTTKTTTLTSTSTSKTFTSSTSSTFTMTSTTSSSTTLTVELAAAIGSTDFVRSTLLLVGTNQTPAGIDDALAVALAESFQMQRSSVEVLSVKAAVAVMFRPIARRLEAPLGDSVETASDPTDPRRALRSAASFEPALETDFQILLPEGSEVTVDEALEAIQAVCQDPQPLLPVLGEVVENYGLTARENVSLRFTMPSADRVESVFVASLWGDCAGGAVCSNLPIPLRSRAVWCARVSDLAAREPDSFCSGAKPRSSEPCPEGVPRPPSCGWQVSNWSSCAASGPCTGRGLQRREAVCLSIPPGDCGVTPETERECQCLMDATVTLTPLVAGEGLSTEADESILLPSILGSLFGLGCCCCLACLCGRRKGRKVKVDVRPESTEAAPHKAVAELLAECEIRQISTKGCLERQDLEDLLKDSENSQLESSVTTREVAATPSQRGDRPSSPVSPSRIQHCPALEDDGSEETKPRASPSASDVSTQRPSGGSPMSSKSSTGLDRSLERPLERPPESPLAAVTSSKAAKAAVPKVPELLPEVLDTPWLEASQSLRPSSSSRSKNPHPLRKTATWSSNVATPSSSRSPTRSRTTLSHLANTSRAADPPAPPRMQRSMTERLGPPPRLGTSPLR